MRFRNRLLLTLGISGLLAIGAPLFGGTSGQNALASSAAAVAMQGSTPDVSPLGPGDQVLIRVLGDDEVPEKLYRVDSEGYLHLPLLGQVKALGLSTRQLETDLVERLRPFIKDPQVTASLMETHSRPVSVLGAVNTPGVHQIEGPKRLLEVISAAGGLRPDAGTTARITRVSEAGDLPLPNARKDLSGKFSVADLDLENILRGRAPEQNILIQPQDVISVSKADLVFVLGEVKKPGGFPIMAHEKISILTAVALAEGTNPSAASKNVRILRENTDGPNRQEITINLAKIMQGAAPDVPLQPNDILVVPRNVGRDVAIKMAEAAVSIGTGIVIWRR